MNKDLIVVNGQFDSQLLDEIQNCFGSSIIQTESQEENAFIMLESLFSEDHVPHLQIDLAGSMIIGPIKCYQGFEYLTIFCLDSNHLSQVLSNFEAHDIRMEILHVHEDNQIVKDRMLFERLPLSKILQSLTQNQLQCLVEAFELGYYDIPRKVTANDIAKDKTMSRQSYEKTLRRAEQKLMNHLIPILRHGIDHSGIFAPKWIDDLLIQL